MLLETQPMVIYLRRRIPTQPANKMLISARRRLLQGDCLELEQWLRAPLYLSTGVRYFAAIENRPAGSRHVEFIISTIDHELWDDLWRIEIDTDDAPGNSALLFSLLESRDLRILCVESSVNTFGTNHSTHIVASAHSYSGDIDLSHRERLKLDKPELDELRREILVYLSDQIAFDTETMPAIKIRQFRTYRRLSDELGSGTRFILNRNGEVFNGQAIPLKARALNHIRRVIGGSDVYYTSAVDTKDRLIRVLFFGSGFPHVNYVQIIVDAQSGPILSKIYGLLYENNANIIRNQVRPAPDELVKSCLAKFCFNTDSTQEEIKFNTVDLTFNFVGLENEEAWDERMKLFDKALTNLCEEEARKCLMTKTSWRQS